MVASMECMTDGVDAHPGALLVMCPRRPGRLPALRGQSGAKMQHETPVLAGRGCELGGNRVRVEATQCG